MRGTFHKGANSDDSGDHRQYLSRGCDGGRGGGIHFTFAQRAVSVTPAVK